MTARTTSLKSQSVYVNLLSLSQSTSPAARSSSRSTRAASPSFAASSATSSAPDDLESGNANLLGRGVSHKYRTLYEQENIASSTPWGRFKEGERQRMAANVTATLPMPEQFLLRGASFTMANTRRRRGLIGYLALLHALVLILLFF